MGKLDNNNNNFNNNNNNNNNNNKIKLKKTNEKKMKEKENTATTTKATKDLVLSTLTTIHSGICFEERKKQFKKHSFRG